MVQTSVPPLAIRSSRPQETGPTSQKPIPPLRSTQEITSLPIHGDGESQSPPAPVFRPRLFSIEREPSLLVGCVPQKSDFVGSVIRDGVSSLRIRGYLVHLLPCIYLVDGSHICCARYFRRPCCHLLGFHEYVSCVFKLAYGIQREVYSSSSSKYRTNY